MTAPAAPRRLWLIGLVIVGVAAAAFLPAVRNGFVYLDDPAYVVENADVLGGLTADGVRWAFLTLDTGYWQPATWLSFQLDATVFGTGPFGFHLTNVVLHAANAGLLFGVLRRATGSTGRSAAAALLWAVHPLRVESVAWATERKDVLSGLFFLLAVAAYLRYAPARSRGWYYLSLVLFGVGLTAKPMLVTLPCVLVLLDAWPLGRLRSARDLPRLLWDKSPFFLLSALFAAITVFAQADVGAAQPLAAYPISERVTTALTGYVAYLGMTIWPADLAGLYPLRPRPVWQPAAAAALLLAVTAVAVALRRRAPYLLVGWLWFGGMTFPVCGLIQSGGQAYADRFTYLPHVGLMTAIVWGLADLGGRLRVPAAAGWAVLAAGVVVLAILTWRQTTYWRDTRTFWERAVAVSPDSPGLWMNLAHTYLSEKEYDAALRCADEACLRSDFAQNFVEARGVMLVVVERKRGLRK